MGKNSFNNLPSLPMLPAMKSICLAKTIVSRLTLVCILLLQLTTSIPAADSATTAAGPSARVTLFDSGKEGYPRYRIPAVIVAPNNDVLAFAEGRVAGGGFTGDIDIVVKRSTDSGKTWGPVQKIADDGPHTFGYPTPVVERQTKTLWLLFTRSRGDDLEKDIVTGTSKERTRVFVMSSKDSGHTWSAPRDISATTRKPEWTWYGLGSGIGLQLQSGRLAIPAYHNVEGTREFSSHIIYSDDRGESWHLGGDVGGQTGECQIAERRDGSLYINTRNQSGQNWSFRPFGTNAPPVGPQYNQRLTAVSTDAGKSWGKVTTDPQLYEGICQGFVYSWPTDKPEDKPLWMFSNPASPKRRDLTIRISHDEGRTWPAARLIQEGASEYSCLTRLPDGQLGCLYERWEDKNIRIFWVRVPLPWLLAGGK
ncbi:sialidase [Verrucomicrobiota bacterium]|nr:sialidase [Verrucomicrobiota bacterium]